MSKITSKNLTYDSTLPPFLSRLYASTSSDDHQKNKVVRPCKARDLDQEAENDPVYFDEETRHTLTKKEWESKELRIEKLHEEKTEMEVNTVALGEEKTVVEMSRNTMKHGMRKKRLIGKVIEPQDDENYLEKTTPTNVGNKNLVNNTIAKPITHGKMKHGKKIKLSFDE